MTDVSVIILVGQEKRHIGRCLEKLKPLEAADVFVVESQPDDGTHGIAVEKGAKTVFHKYPGNQAEQFNWALDNLPIKTKWVLRLDADEYLTESLIKRIRAFVEKPQDDVDLVALKLGRTWQGRRVRFGMPPKYIPRLFRFGVCRYGAQVMDERLEADPARTIRFEEMFIDDNLNTFAWWREKHLGYMKREAQKALGKDHGNKGLYYKLPRYWRAVGYWAIRYFLFLGILDGKAGWSWNWWQGLWYRWKVDQEIGRLQQMEGKNV